MSTAVDIERTVCRQCFAVLDLGDRFCRHCGASLVDFDASGLPVTRVVSAGRSEASSWSESPWVVLAMLFLVLGPLGLPMLWRSRQFSPAWKAVLTLLMLGVTMAVVGLIGYVLHASLKPLLELDKLKGLSLLTDGC